MPSDVTPFDDRQSISDGSGEGRQDIPNMSDGGEPPLWAFGSRVAARNVETGRKAYRRYAEAAEYALNAFEATSARAAVDLRAVAGGTRKTLLQMSDRGFVAAREMRGRWRELDERRFDTFEASAARHRADFRKIALSSQIAIDTNVRSCLDCAEKLAQASNLRDLVAVQATFVFDQWQRSLRQILELQTMTVDLWRKTASVNAA